MPAYVATMNVPGYLGMDDEPPVFDTAQEAWAYLAEQRERDEDDFGDEGEEYSDTRETLAVLGEAAHWKRGDLDVWLATHGVAGDGTGAVYGSTPGYQGDHDLGVAYCVKLT